MSYFLKRHGCTTLNAMLTSDWLIEMNGSEECSVSWAYPFRATADHLNRSFRKWEPQQKWKRD